MAASLEAPILGAALIKETLVIQRDWILEKQRDLEIQDFFRSETLDGDWRSVGAEIRRLLDGYTGRLGIHGPFWGFKIDSQDPFASLNPRMSVGSAIAAPLYAYGLASSSKARDRVADLLDRVGLTADMASRFPHEFSGGQRQRICIARALALGPKLIIADEAISALDVSVKAQVVNLMLDLQASMGLAYLFISHDIAVVERMSHRVAVMYLGEIVEIGPRAAVFENPQHPYTKKLMAAVPIPDPARRNEKRGVSNDEVRSPVRAPDYQPPVRQYREVTPGHVVQVWGEEWSG